MIDWLLITELVVTVIWVLTVWIEFIMIKKLKKTLKEVQIDSIQRDIFHASDIVGILVELKGYMDSSTKNKDKSIRNCINSNIEIYTEKLRELEDIFDVIVEE